MKIILTILTTILLAGCSAGFDSSEPGNDGPLETPAEHSDKLKENNVKTQPSKPKTGPVKPVQQPSQQEFNSKNFFPDSNQVKYFKGTGNEFAEEKETVFEMQGSYLPVIVSNGGTSILKIYKLSDKGISIVYQQPEFYEDDVPAIATLEPNFTEVQILTDSIKEGVVINGWRLVTVNKTLLLPIGTVRNAILLEQVNQDGSISRQYWAPKFGLVKKEFYMEDSSGNETHITSELKAIEKRK